MRKQKANYELIKTIEEFNKAVVNQLAYYKSIEGMCVPTKKEAEAMADPNMAFVNHLRAAATDAAMLLAQEMKHRANGEVV